MASSAELAIRLRRERSRPSEVDRALSTGRLIKTWAMRGALHLLTPKEAGAFLSLMASGRAWDRPSWRRYFGMTAEEWVAAMDALRHVVGEALADRPHTREELAAAVGTQRGLRRLAEELGSSWGTLLKPLAWQGELCFGPSRDGRATFMRPDAATSHWSGIPDPDAAARVAIAAYLAAHGPANIDAFGNWLTGGWFGKRRLRTWFAALGDQVVEIEVDGDRAYVLAEDLDELASARPTTAVRLLPGFDQYVLGPGTADGRVVPPARRAAVSRQAGWISPVVVAGGVVCGTWELKGDHVGVT